LPVKAAGAKWSNVYSLLRSRRERADARRARRASVLGAATLVVLAACRDHDPPDVDAVTPAVTLEPTGLDGRALDPLASPEAAVSVLVFISTHCPISNRYAPTLRSIHERYAERPVGTDVAFYLVYPDPADDAAAVEAHMREFALPGVAVRDPGHALVDAARARVTPEAAVFRAQGKLQELVYHGRIDDRARDFGKVRPEASHHDLVDTLDAVLAGRPVPQPETQAVGCYIVDLD
jgi:hypothetical protein